jgi:RND family efflux transporter MFP subunit
MKTIRKTAGIIITVILIGLTVYELYSGRNEMQVELKRLSDFSADIPVRITIASKQKVLQELTEYGTFRPRREVNVASETYGKILEINVQIGDYVNAGQNLATVEKELLENKLFLARLNLENVKNDLERFKKLEAGNAVTKRQLESARLDYQDAQNTVTELIKQLSHAEITAPVSGFINSRQIEKGSFVVPGTIVYGIADQADLLFAAQMSETDVVKVNKGDKVEISTSVFPEKMEGRVDEIAVKNSLSGRYEVLVKISNPNSNIKPGMSGMGTFQLALKNDVIVIPRKCLTGSILDSRVYIVHGDTVKLEPIQASRLNEEQIIVHSGISAGSQVVTEGQINLKNGTKVKVLN